MSSSVIFKKLAMCSLTTAAMFAASQGAYAHTRLETPTVTEATGFTRVHNQVVISHGCLNGGPTFGTSVVFPNAISYVPIIGIDSGTGKVFNSAPASTYYSPASGIGAMIRTGGPWVEGNNKVDALGNKDGFWAGGISYDQTISTPINVDFYANAVTIAPASCARSVTFELAIVDVCDVSVPGTTVKDEEALFWSPIPNFPGVPGQPFDGANHYSNYDGWADAGHTVKGDGWGSPATLKVTRNLTTNPLPAGCTGNAGAGDDVYVYPSAEQINAELPVWSEPNQTGTNHWQ
jgi:hypothetical protein